MLLKEKRKCLLYKVFTISNCWLRVFLNKSDVELYNSPVIEVSGRENVAESKNGSKNNGKADEQKIERLKFPKMS